MKKMDRKKPKRIKTSHRCWQLAMRRSAKKNRTSVADHSVGNRKSLMMFIRRFVLMICVQRYPFSCQMCAHFYLVRPLCAKCSPKTCLSGGRKGAQDASTGCNRYADHSPYCADSDYPVGPSKKWCYKLLMA